MKRIDVNLSKNDLSARPKIPALRRKISQNSPDTTPTPKKRLMSPKKKTILIILGTMLVLLGACGCILYRANHLLGIMGFNTNPASTIGNLFSQKDPELKKDSQNRTNILLAGIDTRPNNQGLQNTDTIIIASYNHSSNEMIMISIPRDMWAEYPDMPGYFTKINGIYNYCENEKEGTGLECLVKTTETITELDIQYYAMIDVRALVEIVDTIGGIDIDVERSFNYSFPTDQNTWEPGYFEAGMQHMDGETAMKYARSRYSQSAEGSDFARARRQQKLLLAAKDKILSLDTFKTPLTVIEIIEQLGKGITVSDISTEDIRAAMNLRDNADTLKSYSVVLNPMAGNWELITEDSSTAAYVLVPKAGSGNWTNVHEYLEHLYDDPELYTENKKVVVYDCGLGYNEAYTQYLKLIKDMPYLNIVFGGTSAYQQTGNLVVSFDDEAPAASLKAYASYIEGKQAFTPPEGLLNSYAEDISIIFGALEPAADTAVPTETDTTTN